MDVTGLVQPHVQRAIALRHRFHEIPEVGYEEVMTAALIRQELARLGIPFTADVAGAPTATVAHIGDLAKPCIALRADIDGLPVCEQTGVAYASRHAGCMHACGHDGHIAMLLATAAALQPVVSELPVCLKLLWQPAEEDGGGAQRLVEAGVLDGRVGPKARAVLGLHGWPSLPVGVIATRKGPLLAATDNFRITFRGRGAHGAFPHRGRDPIVAAAEAVLSLQQIVSRELDPTDAAVLTVGKLAAGSAVNIIPDAAVLEGTVRTLAPETRRQVRQAVHRRCGGIAAAGGCEVLVEWREGYPPVVNDDRLSQLVAEATQAALGAGRFVWLEQPYMAGEDFAYYGRDVPGCFLLLGTSTNPPTYQPPLHSDHYDFPDAALNAGISTMVAFACAWRPDAR